jgi:hypothetical protein
LAVLPVFCIPLFFGGTEERWSESPKKEGWEPLIKIVISFGVRSKEGKGGE